MADDQFTADDVSDEVRARELRDLSVLLKQPVKKDILARWAHQSPIREGILDGTLWGTIVWRKGLGHPMSAPFANAFTIERRSWQKELVGDANGVLHDVEITIPQPSPSKWDGPHDDEHYRVSFTASAVPQPTKVTVSFVPGVAWTRPSGLHGGFREIEPAARFFALPTGWLVIEPFEVVRRFIDR